MNAKGFTLVELVSVIVILGVLAALAIPRLAATSERSLVASMQSDLGRVRSAQEAYYQTNNLEYASDIADLIGANLFTPTAGVTVVINSGDNVTWDATASHPSSTTTCDYDAAVGVIDCS